MLVNMYPESQQNAKYPYALYGTEGLALSDTLGSGPIRGIRTRNGVSYVVSGSEVYKDGVLLAGVAIAGSGAVSIAHNSTQVVIVAGGNGYVVTTAVAQITDADWLTSDTVTYLNGKFVFNERGTGRAFSSAIEDASDLDALDFATAESNADNLRGVYSEGDRLLMAGTETMEFWYNDGGPQFPFSRIPGSTAKTGLVSPYALTFNDNTFFFVGHDLSVYRMGTVPERISTPYIERKIKSFTELSTCEASTYSITGHIFVIFDFNEGTLVYDVVTKKWHERRSYKKSNWRCGRLWQDGAIVYAGDKSDGSLYTLDDSTYTENGATHEAIIQLPALTNGEEWFNMSRVKVDIDVGVGLTTGQGSDPQLMMQFSDDGGNTWSYELWADMGEIGEYYRECRWNRLPRSKGRIFRFKITDPVQRAILGVWFDG
jgi:hypothetical protein